ncbi:hypothetical protein BaRGS_00033845 [Batillaria attramentaria]|uniref:Uncharacterized protein n=1 Tax=Batillaria attramentaria TaxID=370345 RepID=A0ABD0JIX3_9CAEN
MPVLHQTLCYDSRAVLRLDERLCRLGSGISKETNPEEHDRSINRSDEVYWHVQHHKQDAVAKNSERRAVIQPQRTATRIGSGGSKCVKVNIPRRTSMNTPPTTMPVFRNTPLSVANSLHATYGCQMRLHGTLLVTKTCSHRVRTVTNKMK